MSEVSDAFEEIMNEIDIKSGDLSGDQYEELLTELNSEIEIRLQLIEEEK